MATVIGVRFKKANKVYYFDPTGVWPKAGDQVIVETVRGLELGEVVTGAREVDDEQIVAPLKKVLRIASLEDVKKMESNIAREGESYRVCQERIAYHKLEMKLVDVEYTFDGSKIIFYFTANGRVDFRELVKDLAGIFKMRIELRQIGVRDEAKMLGGLGSCGRPICCRQFLSDFQPVSIKMAKEQNLSLNPTKISGQCGRLMCCLKYEQDHYEKIHKQLPKVGRDIMTPDGMGIISDINAIREKVRVRIRNSDDSYDMREYELDEVSRPTDKQRAQEETTRKPRPQERGDGRNNRDNRGRGPQAKPAEQPKKEEEQKKEKPRRRIVHPKGPKQMNTDEYFKSMGPDGAPNAQEKQASGAANGAETAQKPRGEEPSAASPEISL